MDTEINFEQSGKHQKLVYWVRAVIVTMVIILLILSLVLEARYYIEQGEIIKDLRTHNYALTNSEPCNKLPSDDLPKAPVTQP